MEAYETSAVGRVELHAVCFKVALLATGVTGMIKPCRMALGSELSCLMTGGDSRVALKQNKRQWQFAVSSAAVKTAVQKQMLGISNQQSLQPDDSNADGHDVFTVDSGLRSPPGAFHCHAQGCQLFPCSGCCQFPYHTEACLLCEITNQSSDSPRGTLILTD